MEELNLGNRLQAAGGHACCAAHNRGFGYRGVEAALRAVLYLQSRGGLEDSALALHLAQIVLARAVRHILTEHNHARIAPHLFR